MGELSLIEGSKFYGHLYYCRKVFGTYTSLPNFHLMESQNFFVKQEILLFYKEGRNCKGL